MQHRDYVFRFAYFTKAQLWQFSPHSISSLENARKKTFGFYIALWKLHTQSQNTRLKDKYNAIPRHEEATHKISKLFPVLDICIVIVSSMFVLHHVQHDGNIFLLYVFQLFSLGSFYPPPFPRCCSIAFEHWGRSHTAILHVFAYSQWWQQNAYSTQPLTRENRKLYKNQRQWIKNKRNHMKMLRRRKGHGNNNTFYCCKNCKREL